MIMKKQIISWGMMLAAAFTLTNCAKEIEGPAQEPETNGYPFEIVASAVSTKTVNDGMATKWVDNDKINLFHAEAGGTDYKNDNAFTVADVEAGRFTGELSTALETGKKYDWYAIYPYSSQIKTPGERAEGYTYLGRSNGLNQTGYNSTDALDGSNCPFYGVAKSVDANSIPSIDMKHLSSVVAINVTNTTDTPVTITTASLTATEDIVGSYYIDITGSSVAYNPSSSEYVKNTATVNVSGGTALANGESAILYLAIKPFTAAEGTNLVLSVNGLEKTLEMPNDVEFYAGKIKTLNFKYDEKNVEVPAISVADFMELEDGAKVYELTGVITGIYQAYNSQYGNISFYITDDTGTVLIFRMTCDDILAKAITVGDEITVRGSKTTHSGTAQMAQGGVCVSHRDGCATPVISCSDNMVTITFEDGAKVYYTTDGTDPTISSTPYTAPFAITETNTVKAIAVADGKLTSLVAEKECVWVDLDAEQPATVTATLKFTDISTRTEYNTEKQVWEENGLMLVGEKAGSSTAVGNYSNPARFYKSSTITIKAPGNITKLVFESASDGSDDNKKYLSFLTTAVGDHTVNDNFVTVILDGTSNAVTYTMPGQVRLFNLEVTYIAGDGGEEPEQLKPRNLAFSAATATATVGQPFTAPTLNGVTTGVEYTSSNTAVATVNAETGAVTLVGAGTTTIKASAPATAEYEAGEASYTLTVSAAEILVENGSYVIAVLEEGVYYAVSSDANDARRAYVELNDYSGEESYVSHNSKIVWTITNVDGGITINTGDQYWGTKKNGITLVTSNNAATIAVSRSENAYHLSGDCGTDGIRYVSKNDTYGFGFYAESNKEDIYLIPATFVALPDLAAPVATAELNNAKDGINVSWNAVPNAQKYVVTCGENSVEVTDTNYEFTGLSAGTYSITVKAVAENYNSATSEAISVTVPSAGGGDEPEQPGEGGGEGSEPVTVSKLISEISGTTTDGTKVSELKLDDVITASASTAGNNGKVYDSGKEWRLYMSDNGTVTISAIEGYTISTVKFTYNYSNSGVLLKGTTQIKSGAVDTVNAQYVTYTVGRTGGTKQGQVKVTAIEVVYQAN